MKLWRILGIALILALGVCLLIAGPTFALVEQKSLDDLADEADVVVLGEVTDITSYQDDDGIYTIVTLEVEQAIKGETGQEVEVRVPGGEVNGIGLWVEDAPIFQTGERVVVFLEETNAALEVCGWSEGKFTIEGDRVVKLDQSLDNFIAEIEGLAGVDLPENLISEPASAILDFQLESRIVEPAIAEDYMGGWQTIMSDGFEDSFPGNWTVGASSEATDAYWGKDSYRDHSGSYSAFCAKNGTAGVEPPSNYRNDMEAWMIYGPFDLYGASDAELDLFFWLNTEPINDVLLILASTDGSNFYGYQTYGDSGGWQYASIDLTDMPTLGNLCGEPGVYIAFVFVSNESVTYDGAFLDDLVLRKYCDGGTVAQITDISPSSASAGTGSQVTITGTNFGATQGTGGVQFWWRGSTYLPADIVSWSNTSIVCKVPSGASSGCDVNGVRVITGAGPSNDYPFNVTFSYAEQMWLLSDPMNEKYVINENTADCTGELEAVLASMQTWNDVDSADFYFEYGGVTTATTVSLNEPNGENEILWVDSDPGFGISGWIAVNLHWYNTSTGEIFESDILFNNYDFTWDTSGSPAGSEMDVQNVATHELGHTLCLLDLYGDDDFDKTMYGFGTSGETYKRTLHDADEEGIRWIYDGTGSRGQYHVSVTNNDDDDLAVSFKADTDAGYTEYRQVYIPAGETRNSILYVLSATNHQVSIQWNDPDKGTADELTSASLPVTVEGDTGFNFTIPQYPSALVVTTDDATAVTETTANLNGNLDDIGGETSADVSFEWGIISGALDQETTPQVMTESGPFTADLSNLTANTTYYFQAKAVGTITVYGQEASFTTDITTPTMEMVAEAEGAYYSTAPTFANFGFDDNFALDDGWYQLDAYAGSWTALFTNASGTSWDSDSWTIPDFGTLAEGSHTIYFQASDDAGNIEGESGEWNWQFYKDTVAPTDPTDVTSQSHNVSTWSTDNTVDITWTAATDATSGLDGYSILWNTSPDTIPDHTKDIEEGIEAIESPALADGYSHYFHISSVDNAGNWQTTVHIGPFYVDATAPEAITDLTVGSHAVSSLKLTWTAPGEGVANSAYDIRYSTDLIIDANWDLATVCIGEPVPATPGTLETFTVEGLTESTTYYFALKTSDELSRWSELSNVPDGTPVNSPPVLSCPQVDPTIGYTTTTFTYSVVYTDGDNDGPASITVTINEATTVDMTEQDDTDTDYTDGKGYEYYINGSDLGLGTEHTFQFTASDGSNDATGNIEVHIGPYIVEEDALSWHSMRSGFDETLWDVCGVSPNEIFAVGSGDITPDCDKCISNAFLKYDGTDWSPIEIGFNCQLYGVWGSSGSDIYAVGNTSPWVVEDDGIIIHYNGTSCVPIETGITERLYDIWGSSSSDIYAVGAHGVILHYDGNEWTQIEGIDTKISFKAIWGSSASDIFVVGGVTPTPGIPSILHYDGISWQPMLDSTISSQLFGVWGSSPSDVYAVGGLDEILHYDGNTWQSSSLGINQRFNDVWGRSANDVYVTASPEGVIHYDGSEWSTVPGSDSFTVCGVGGTDSEVFVVGLSGSILYYGTKDLPAIWAKPGREWWFRDTVTDFDAVVGESIMHDAFYLWCDPLVTDSTNITINHDNSDFTIFNNITSLGSGSWVVIRCTFTPTQAGIITDNFTVLSDVGNVSFQLIGNGVPSESPDQWIIDLPADTSAERLLYDTTRDLLYITDANGNRLLVFSPEQQRIVTMVPVGNKPVDLAITPDKTRLYVTNSGEPTISEIELDTLTETRRFTLPWLGYEGTTPYSIAMISNTVALIGGDPPGAASGRSIWELNLQDLTLTERDDIGRGSRPVIKTSGDYSTTVILTEPGSSPTKFISFDNGTGSFVTSKYNFIERDIAINEDGTIMFATSYDSSPYYPDFRVFDRDLLNIIHINCISLKAFSPIIHPNGEYLYSYSDFTGSIQEVNLNTYTQVRDLDYSVPDGYYALARPKGLAISGDGTRLYAITVQTHNVPPSKLLVLKLDRLNISIPSIDSLSITPDPAFTDTNLTATPTGWFDADGDPEGYQWQWQKWEEDEWKDIEGATTDTLASTNFVKDDQVKIICIPWDGIHVGDPLEATITISNSLPEAPVIDITPDAPSASDNLVCAITTSSTDADEDAITNAYAWYRDTVLQPELSTDTIGYEITEDGEVWKCIVTPYDGTDYGPSGEDEVTIGAPLLSDGSVEPAEGNTSVNFTYSVVYTQGDNEAPTSITVTIDEGAPEEMSVREGENGNYTDGETYEYIVTGSSLGEGAHEFQFAASDGTYAAVGDVGVHIGPTVSASPGGGGGGGGGGPDTSAPRFSNITATDISKTGATVSWETQEKSDSQVEYWASPHQFSPLDETLVRNHVVQLIDLNPATTYSYRVISHDAAGNQAVSDEFTLTTLGTPAVFNLSKLEVTPVEVFVGDEVVIKVFAKNTGEAAGVCNITLGIDGAEVDSKDLELSGGESQMVIFDYIPTAAGYCEVNVNELTYTLSVLVKPEPLPQPSEVTIQPTTEQDEPTITLPYISWLIAGGVALCLALFLVYYFGIRKRGKNT